MNNCHAVVICVISFQMLQHFFLAWHCGTPATRMFCISGNTVDFGFPAFKPWVIFTPDLLVGYMKLFAIPFKVIFLVGSNHFHNDYAFAVSSFSEGKVATSFHSRNLLYIPRKSSSIIYLLLTEIEAHSSTERNLSKARPTSQSSS